MIGITRRVAYLVMASMVGLFAIAMSTQAQDAKQDQGQDGDAQELVQVKLTEAHINGFIKSQPALAKMSERMKAAGDKEDKKLDADLEKLAKKFGYKDYGELENVAANILFVLDVTDPKTGKYQDPEAELKAELEAIKKDDKIAAAEKKKAIADINEALKTVPKLEHKENIALVNKHRAAILKVLE